jgi:quercetin dioxygenase-like cupin family protein
VLLASVVSLSEPFAAPGQPPSQSNVGITTTTVLNNDRVSVIRMTFDVGARQAFHAPNFDIVVTQTIPGEARWRIGSEETSGYQEVGKVWYVKKGTLHSTDNIGSKPFELMVVVLK